MREHVLTFFTNTQENESWKEICIESIQGKSSITQWCAISVMLSMKQYAGLAWWI